jgi:putative hydrolase of the HAD superfamily
VALARAIHDARHWFWGDPERHARERIDMLGAWTKIAALGLERIGRPSEATARAVAFDFAGRRAATTTLFDDALPCLGALRARGLPLGLVTNGDARMQRDKLVRHDLGGLFDVVVIEGEFGVGKPDVAVYEHALRVLGVEATGTIMVGDNFEWDVAGAARAGITGVWLDRAGEGRADAASTARTIRTLAEIAGA